MLKISKEIDPSLYPEVKASGGLPEALSQVLTDIGSGVSAKGLPDNVSFIPYARVERANRFSQTKLAAEKRLFVSDLWRDGFEFARFGTADLSESASLIKLWVEDSVTLGEISAHSIVSVTEAAWSWDRGTETEYRWSGLLRTLGERIPELAQFVEAAADQPQLRQLFPYTSMNRFCFSRCTRYPYTRDTPVVHPLSNKLYEVHLGRKLIGTGDAVAAANMVVANLPEGCGPAVRGTAETM